MLTQTLVTGTEETEAGGSVSLKPDWSTELVLEQSGLHRENLSQQHTQPCHPNQIKLNQKGTSKAKKIRGKASETGQCEAGSPAIICFLEDRLLRAAQAPCMAVEGLGAHLPGVCAVCEGRLSTQDTGS